MNSRRLHALLSAVAPLGLLGCGSSLGPFDGKICLSGENEIGDLSPAGALDYLALRHGDDQSGQPPQTYASWGDPCSGASDREACLEALESLPMDAPIRSLHTMTSTYYDVPFTRGDEIAEVVDRAAMIELLGPIDTPTEAALDAFAARRDLDCSQNNWRKQGDAFVLLGIRGGACNTDIVNYEIIVEPDGGISEGDSEVVDSVDCGDAVAGRRPDALRSKTQKSDAVGGFFAGIAHLEAAAVHAFAQLACELSVHGAPRRLVAAAWCARRDEIRHARITSQLARCFGAEPVPALVGPRDLRPLFEVALDNATEGCVRETYGAAVAMVQAKRARSRTVRRALGPIARDETRHAALSWAIDQWLGEKLGGKQRRALADARHRAVATLREDTAAGWSPAIRAHAGMPGAEAAMAMVSKLDAALWRC